MSIRSIRNAIGWVGTRRLRQIGLVLMVSLWASSVLGAILWQDQYTATAGTPAVAPMNWPGGDALPLDAGQFNLLVFLHPQCPCSRATVNELARLVASAGPQVQTRVVVLQYAGQDVRSNDAPLYRQAAAIPGVKLQVDPDGSLARRFNAACSGQTLLYGPAGRLLFSGGITPGRGHEGDNAGESAVLRLVSGSPRGQATPAAATPVYGCPLFAASTALLKQEPACHR